MPEHRVRSPEDSASSTPLASGARTPTSDPGRRATPNSRTWARRRFGDAGVVLVGCFLVAALLPGGVQSTDLWDIGAAASGRVSRADPLPPDDHAPPR